MTKQTKRLLLTAMVIGAVIAAVWVARSSRRGNEASQAKPISRKEAYQAPGGIAALNAEEIEVVRRLVEDLPRSADSINLLGLVLSRQGDSTEAVECWRKSFALNPRHALSCFNMGTIAQRQGEYERAVELFHKALEIDPKIPEAYHRLARARLSQGKPKEAVTAWAAKLELSPGDSETWFHLGKAYLLLKDYEKAKEQFEKAIEIRRDHAGAYYGLVTACSRLNQAEKSRQYLKEFKRLKAVPRDSDARRLKAHENLASVRRTVAQTYTDAGEVYRQSGKPDEAEVLWRKAEVLDAKNTSCRLKLASLYLSSKRNREALRICEGLSKIESGKSTHYLNVGILCYRLNQHDGAEKAFLKAIELESKQSAGYRELAELYLRTDTNFAQARKLAAMAVQLEPIAPNYFITGWACEKYGDLTGALAALERAIALDPTNPQYRRRHAELLKRRQ